MVSGDRVTIHRGLATLRTLHRRVFARALCRAMPRAIGNTLDMETTAISAAGTMAGEAF